MNNVYTRILLEYGEKSEIKFESEIDKYTSVTLKIPYELYCEKSEKFIKFFRFFCKFVEIKNKMCYNTLRYLFRRKYKCIILKNGRR